MTPVRIPISRPNLEGNEEAYIVKALRSSWISSSGEFLDRFEREFAEACDASTALAVCNGTVALHLALLGLNVTAGDEVIVPALTYVATANAVRYVGAEPVFVDVDPRSWCIDPSLIERSITPRTRGIIPVHLYGHPADMDAITEIATRHGLWVIEDAAEAHFARYKGQPVGGLSTVGTFSFYGNKSITCGEGGAVIVNDDILAHRLRMLRGQGMDPNRRYYHPITGYNFRLTNIAAAILCAQLERASVLIEQRYVVRSVYEERLADSPISFQKEVGWVESSPWMTCILLPTREDRDRIANLLAEDGVETRPLFIPLHRMPPFAEVSARRKDHMPVSDDLSDRGLCLPTYPGLMTCEIHGICDTILRSM